MMRTANKLCKICHWLAALAMLLATGLACAGVQFDIDKELQLLRDGQAKVHIGGARYRFAVFTFEDPDGTGLGNAIASILSHDLLLNGKVSSLGVLRYLGNLSEPSGKQQLRYFDKVEPLIESQGVQVALWGNIRRSGNGIRIDSFVQISPSVMEQTFSYTFRLPRNFGAGQLVHRIGPNRILAQRLELSSDQAQTLAAQAAELDRLRASPKDSAKVSGELPLGQVYYIQQRQGAWAKVVVPSGKSGWLRASSFCTGPCAPLLAVSRFGTALMAYDADRSEMPSRNERLAADALAFVDQVWAIMILNGTPAAIAEDEALFKLEPWCRKDAENAGSPAMPSPGGAATCNLRAVVRFVAALRRAAKPPHTDEPSPVLVHALVDDLASASMSDPRHVPTLQNLATLFNLLGDTERAQLATRLAQEASAPAPQTER